MDFKKREEQTGHAVCSPSQLYRIMACPASIQESLQAPISPPSSYALHGTLLHDITYDFLTKSSSFKTKFAALEIEDRNAIEDALDYVRDVYAKCPADDTIMAVESKVDLSWWNMKHVYGTLDLSLFTGTKLHIIDWKFGAGVSVAAEGNQQLLTYAAGSMGKYKVGLDITPIPIEIHVVQPFISNFDMWETDSFAVSKWVLEKLEPALIHAMSDEGKKEYHPGEKQCRFCPSAMTCRARLMGSQKTAKEVFRIHSQVSTATKPELSALLKRAEDLKKYISQIQQYAMAELSAGRSFTGYKLVAGRSQRKWIDEDKVEAWLSGNSAIKEGDLFKKKLVSPAQAEKLDRLLKKDLDFKALIHKPAGTSKLATEDDKRPAIVPNDEAKEAFSDWQQSEED